jgi:hypothetical protein
MLLNTVWNKVYKLHYQKHKFFTKSYQKLPVAAAATADLKWAVPAGG